MHRPNLSLSYYALFVVFAILIICVSESYAETAIKQTTVKSAGETIVAAQFPGLAVQIKIGAHEVTIGKPSDGRPEAIRSNCTYSRYPCSIVDYLDISVNGKPVFVPRSVFSDLADLNTAEIRRDGNGAELTLNGGDASESYTIEILLNKAFIKSRTLIDGESGKTLQKTNYFQVID